VANSLLDTPNPTKGREHVTLVHGFLANTLMLFYLRHRLRDAGFQTRAWGYLNMCCSIRQHAQRFACELQSLDADPGIATIHLVLHSMGSIIARAALEQFRPHKLGRLVMLAPPNRGSFAATRAMAAWGGLFKPLRELSTASDSFVNRLSMPDDVDIGIIAARYDFLVSLESTRPDVPHAHAILPCLHSSLLFRRDSADLIAMFLKQGSFGHNCQISTPQASPSALPAQAGSQMEPLSGNALSRSDGAVP